MSRLNVVERESATGPTRDLLDAVQKQFGRVPNFMAVLANDPGSLEGFTKFHAALGNGRLDQQTRERIALAMAEANACQYCVSAHTALGARAGLDESEIEAARRGGSADAKADAAVRFAKTVLDNDGDVTTAELNDVRDAGFDDGEIVEIIAHVAINTWTNFLGKVGQIDVDFPEVELLDEQLVTA